MLSRNTGEKRVGGTVAIIMTGGILLLCPMLWVSQLAILSVSGAGLILAGIIALAEYVDNRMLRDGSLVIKYIIMLVLGAGSFFLPADLMKYLPLIFGAVFLADGVYELTGCFYVRRMGFNGFVPGLTLSIILMVFGAAVAVLFFFLFDMAAYIRFFALSVGAGWVLCGNASWLIRK